MAQQSAHARPNRVAILRFNLSLLSPLQRAVLIALAGTLAVFVALGLIDLMASRGKIHAGVVVDGVALGGQTPSEAAARLAPIAAALSGEPVVAAANARDLKIWPRQVGFLIDTKATVDRAFRVGRAGFPFATVGVRLRGWLGAVRVAPVVRYDARRLELRVAELAATFDGAAADARVIDIDGHPAAVPAAVGITVRRSEARRALLGALGSRFGRRFVLPIDTIAPRVSTDAARAAAAQLDIAISTPLELTYSKRAWIIKSAIIRRWMVVTAQATGSRLDAPLTLVVAPSFARVSSTIAKITSSIVKPAADARFTVGGGTVRVIASRMGLAVDTKAAFDLITRQLSEPNAKRKVILSTHAVVPKLTTIAAQQMGIRQRISTFTTNYNSGNPPRVNNIHLLAKALDNTLIRPGDEFSFNRTIGPRTAAKGYQEAPIIVGGKLVPGLGGGICQVGTTIFNTVFFSGLPINERHNHSFYISHYPNGRDATVSWDGPDFRFANSTDSWILIKTAFSSDSVTISLYGTNPGYVVAFKTSPWTYVTSFPIQQIQDPKLPVGTQIVEDVGVGGHDVTVWRTVRQAGKVVRQDSFSSTYGAKSETVRVGTKAPPRPKPPKPQPSPAPTSTPKPKPPKPTPPTTRTP